MAMSALARAALEQARRDKTSAGAGTQGELGPTAGWARAAVPASRKQTPRRMGRIAGPRDELLRRGCLLDAGVLWSILAPILRAVSSPSARDGRLGRARPRRGHKPTGNRTEAECTACRPVPNSDTATEIRAERRSPADDEAPHFLAMMVRAPRAVDLVAKSAGV